MLTINDGGAARRAVAAIRQAGFGRPILARVRFVAEQRELLRLGADCAVAEEVHASEVLAVELLERFGERLPQKQAAD